MASPVERNASRDDASSGEHIGRATEAAAGAALTGSSPPPELPPALAGIGQSHQLASRPAVKPKSCLAKRQRDVEETGDARPVKKTRNVGFAKENQMIVFGEADDENSADRFTKKEYIDACAEWTLSENAKTLERHINGERTHTWYDGEVTRVVDIGRKEGYKVMEKRIDRCLNPEVVARYIEMQQDKHQLGEPLNEKALDYALHHGYAILADALAAHYFGDENTPAGIGRDAAYLEAYVERNGAILAGTEERYLRQQVIDAYVRRRAEKIRAGEAVNENALRHALIHGYQELADALASHSFGDEETEQGIAREAVSLEAYIETGEPISEGAEDRYLKQPVIDEYMRIRGKNIGDGVRVNENALHYALTNEYGRLAVALMKETGAVECRDEAGWTPLMTAAMNGDVGMIGELLRIGADVNAIVESGDDVGRTALSLALSGGHDEAAAALRNAGAV